MELLRQFKNDDSKNVITCQVFQDNFKNHASQKHLKYILIEIKISFIQSSLGKNKNFNHHLFIQSLIFL